MSNYVNGTEIPLGLGMAMAQNLEAMNYFSSLGKEKQQSIIDHTHSIHSHTEMQNYVANMFK